MKLVVSTVMPIVIYVQWKDDIAAMASATPFTTAISTVMP
jgi:hypothetical protein